MQWLSDFAQWLLDLLLFVPRWLWSQLLDVLAFAIESIPVPDAVSVWSTNVGGLPSSVVWFLTIMQFKFGLTLVAGALLARFLLRRIPLVG